MEGQPQGRGAGEIELPAIRYQPPNPLARRKRPHPMLIDTMLLGGALSDIRPILLQPPERQPKSR